MIRNILSLRIFLVISLAIPGISLENLVFKEISMIIWEPTSQPIFIGHTLCNHIMTNLTTNYLKTEDKSPVERKELERSTSLLSLLFASLMISLDKSLKSGSKDNSSKKAKANLENELDRENLDWSNSSVQNKIEILSKIEEQSLEQISELNVSKHASNDQSLLPIEFRQRIDKNVRFLSILKNGIRDHFLYTQELSELYPQLKKCFESASPRVSQLQNVEIVNSLEIMLTFKLPKVDIGTSVYRSHHFKQWINSTTYVEFNRYRGRLLHNITSDCAVWFLKKKSSHHFPTCNSPHHLDVTPTNSLSVITTDNSTINAAKKPKVRNVGDRMLIQCFHHRIIIEKRHFECPMFPFELPIRTNWTIEGLYTYHHDAKEESPEMTDFERLLHKRLQINRKFNPWQMKIDLFLFNLSQTSNSLPNSKSTNYFKNDLSNQKLVSKKGAMSEGSVGITRRTCIIFIIFALLAMISTLIIDLEKSRTIGLTAEWSESQSRCQEKPTGIDPDLEINLSAEEFAIWSSCQLQIPDAVE